MPLHPAEERALGRMREKGPGDPDYFRERVLRATRTPRGEQVADVSGEALRSGGVYGPGRPSGNACDEEVVAASPGDEPLPGFGREAQERAGAELELACACLRRAGLELVRASVLRRRVRIATREGAAEREESRVEVEALDHGRTVLATALSAARLDVATRPHPRDAILPPKDATLLVLLEARAAAVLFHELAHGFEADAATGRAAHRSGERLFPAALWMTDDPSLPGRGGSFLVDDEGATARPVELVAAGVTSGRLLDRRGAAESGGHPSGHARRASFRDPPLPRLSNLVVRAGTTRAEDLARRAGARVGRVTAGAATLDGAGARLLVPEIAVDGRLRGRARLDVERADLADALLGDRVEVVAAALCSRLGQELAVSTACPAVLVRARVSAR